MSKSRFFKFALPLVLLVLLTAWSQTALGAATIVIQNNDSAGAGFNDATPVSSVGGNTGTTLGQQRLNAFQFAANVWGATLNSNVTITIRASWSSTLTCSSSSAVLGQAGPNSIFRNFPNAPLANTWYAAALANALAGNDLNSSSPEITAEFNARLGNTGCLDGTHFYLGLDNNHGADIDLVTVLMHEFAHGLGFETFTDETTGQQAGDSQGGFFPSIFDDFLFDNRAGKNWAQMTDAERKTSAIDTGNLVWTGSQTTTDVGSVLGTPRLRVNAPAGIAGNYAVGTADFGGRLNTSGGTGSVVQALDPSDSSGASTTDGCSSLTNAGSVTGKIALIDRGTCTFVTKVKNAQNAGAVGVIIANNTSGTIQMGGADATITIPVLMISQADGSTIKGQLPSGVNATLLIDTSVAAGADAQHHALLYTPNPVEGGSSVSHWDTTLSPNQLMEPDISGDLLHSVVVPQDLTFSLLKDLGWTGAGATPTPSPTPTPNPIDTPDFFVRQHYSDFLNRQPDDSGLSFWSSQIISCGTDPACISDKRVNVSAAFYLSIEFQQTGYLVERIYKAAYGDASGTSTLGGSHPVSAPIVRFTELLSDSQAIGQGLVVGQTGWETVLENNKQTYVNNFVSLARFRTAFPNSMTAAQFVDKLNANAGNPLSTAERDQLVSDLQTSAKTRAQVLRAVAEDPDLNTAELNRAFVLMQFFGYLRRNPNDAPDNDYTGYDFWLTKLNQFNGNFVNAEMVKAFITSAEYRQRFGP
jgi:hypothetical protein